MKRIVMVIGLAAGALVTAPSMAQQVEDAVGNQVGRDTVPVQLTANQIMTLQQRLNKRGFSAGRVDGLWGPNTSAALERFQTKNDLNTTGELDHRSWVALGMPGREPVSVAPGAGPASRSDAGPTSKPTQTAAAMNTGATGTAPMPQPVAVVPPAPRPIMVPGQPAALPGPVATSGTGAVAPRPAATTHAGAQRPAHGANSFTQRQAQGRIESDGYQNVNDLTLDNNGVWRGTAIKGGQSVHVWLDYQGDIGQQ